MGAVSTQASKLRVRFILRSTQIWDHHSDNLALCGSLLRGDGLRVHLQRDPAVRVPQELLDSFHIFPIRLQQRAEGMTEGVPTDALVNAVGFGHRPDMTLH